MRRKVNPAGVAARWQTSATIGAIIQATCLLTIAAGLAACSEATRITTNPPGAKVTVNGRFLGLSPVVYEVRRRDWPPDNRFIYVVEQVGYSTKEGEFHGEVTPGRIIGSIFATGGLSLAWKGAMSLPRVHVELEPSGGPSVTESTPAEPKAPIEDRLERVDELYDEGLISERERRRLRSRILSEEP